MRAFQRTLTNFYNTYLKSPPPQSKKNKFSSEPTLDEQLFYQRNGYLWDFCIVFPNQSRAIIAEENKTGRSGSDAKFQDDDEARTKDQEAHKILTDTRAQTLIPGVECSIELSSKKSHKFYKIRVEEWKLRDFAIRSRRKLRLNNEKIKNRAEGGLQGCAKPKLHKDDNKSDKQIQEDIENCEDKEHFKIKPFFIADDPKYCKFSPYDCIYAPLPSEIGSLSYFHKMHEHFASANESNNKPKSGPRNCARNSLLRMTVGPGTKCSKCKSEDIEGKLQFVCCNYCTCGSCKEEEGAQGASSKGASPVNKTDRACYRHACNFFLCPACMFSQDDGEETKDEQMKKFQQLIDIESLYETGPGLTHPFDDVIRLQLIYNILRADEEEDGCKLHLGVDPKEEEEFKKRMKKSVKKFIDTPEGSNLLLEELQAGVEHLKHSAYPLHHEKLRRRLKKNWNRFGFQWKGISIPERLRCQKRLWATLTYPSWRFFDVLEYPFEELKAYFGEKIALYFWFLGHYTHWLFYFAPVGFLSFVCTPGNTSSVVAPFFSVIGIGWATGMLEYWKRRQQEINLRWGTHGAKAQEQERPTFKEEQPSISRQKDLREKMWDVLCLHATIKGIIFVCIVGVFAMIVSIFGLRYYLEAVKHYEWGSTLGSFLNSVQIYVLNILYSKVAVWATDRENHMTDTSYEDSLIAKLFVFQFANSYSSFFYLAFIQKLLGVDDDPTTSLMNTLTENIRIVFVVNILAGNFQEAVLPLLVYKYKMFVAKRAKQEMSEVEKEYTLQDYNALGTINDYAELACQFGYVILFVVAAPLAPVFALINNVLEIYTDGYKLLSEMRRPVPIQVESIGVWYDIFQTILMISVVTNSALICFIMNDIFGGYSLQVKAWGFVLLQYLAFSCLSMLAYMIPDISAGVSTQLQREAYLTKKLINQVADPERKDYNRAVDNQECGPVVIHAIAGDLELPNGFEQPYAHHRCNDKCDSQSISQTLKGEPSSRKLVSESHWQLTKEQEKVKGCAEYCGFFSPS